MERVDYHLLGAHKPSLFNLWPYLAKTDLLATPVHMLIDEMSHDGHLYVVGGEARRLMGYEVKTLTSTPNSVQHFDDEIKMHIPNLKSDFVNALQLADSEIKLDDLDLIIPNVRKAAISWLAKATVFPNIGMETDATMATKPHRMSIFTKGGGGFKIDIASFLGGNNARFGKAVTKHDGTMLLVRPDLSVEMDPFLFNTNPPHGILGEKEYLFESPGDSNIQAIALRYIFQSLMVHEEHGRVSLFLGDSDEEITKTFRWLVESQCYIILNREENPRLYYKLLYIVVPNWDLFSPEIKAVIKGAFSVAKSVNQEMRKRR